MRPEEAAMDRVGVIGLGKMGLPIARNLMVRDLDIACVHDQVNR